MRSYQSLLKEKDISSSKHLSGSVFCDIIVGFGFGIFVGFFLLVFLGFVLVVFKLGDCK